MQSQVNVQTQNKLHYKWNDIDRLKQILDWWHFLCLYEVNLYTVIDTPHSNQINLQVGYLHIQVCIG